MFDKIAVLSIRGRENIQFRESAHKQHSSSLLCTFLLLYRYFIFTSFWAYKIYYVYGFMLLVFIILTIVTVCVTIVCTYFLLNAEDYRWYVQSASLFSSSLSVWRLLSDQEGLINKYHPDERPPLFKDQFS